MRHISIVILIFTTILSSNAAAQYVDFDFNGSRFCGLLEDGKVKCTRVYNASSPNLQPDSQLSFTEVHGGNHFNCGITTDGVVDCWGDEPNEGQTSPPSFDSSVVKLSAGPYHACAIDEGGTLKCWGQNVHGQTDPPASAIDLIDIHVFGIYSTCGVKKTEELVCWGQQGNVNPTAPLFSELASIPMTQARFNFDTGCIVRPDGTAAC